MHWRELLSTFLIPRPWRRVSSPSSWQIPFLIHSHSRLSSFRRKPCSMTRYSMPFFLPSIFPPDKWPIFFMHFPNRPPSLIPLLPQRTQPYHMAAAPIGRLHRPTSHCLTARPPCMDIIVMSQGCVPVSSESIISPFSFLLLDEPLVFSRPLAFQFYSHFRFILGLRGSTVGFCMFRPSFCTEQGVISVGSLLLISHSFHCDR